VLKRLLDIALFPVETAVVFPMWLTISVVVEVHNRVDLGIPVWNPA
jgi:lipopolysaccharide/colanic/teichoic acid biosynthesis glycosyltransferase